MKKIRVGIFFGGRSKEREVSFAGGRTVFDNLDKSLFVPVPVFVDGHGNFVLLSWDLVYKGSIRDFFPPEHALPQTAHGFQVYAESLNADPETQKKLLSGIGTPLEPSDFKSLFDLAFLCLHGPYGEDGRLQGLLEYYEIPYTGSGILPSCFGIDKTLQHKFMQQAGFNCPARMAISRKEGLHDAHLFQKAVNTIGFPMVIKPASQGSSIGVSILQDHDPEIFREAIFKSLFCAEIKVSVWKQKNTDEKERLVRRLFDIREGIGLPVMAGETLLHHPDAVYNYVEEQVGRKDVLFFESLDADHGLLIESFIRGKEFSCIVIENYLDGLNPVALPPTEIIKGQKLFDYRSKYLPGLSRKITPIDLPAEAIQSIREECCRLYHLFGFDAYARIDGFYGDDGKVYLNDPNTTSGMMPSSFFFHQAAEIGLNPSQFLSFIIRVSLEKRKIKSQQPFFCASLIHQIDKALEQGNRERAQKKKVAVILGGYSSERHISVESGRNIYEKLFSSETYSPTPVFLTGSSHKNRFFILPVNLLLKDNADDIRDKVLNYNRHPYLEEIGRELAAITQTFTGAKELPKPIEIAFTAFRDDFDAVFIALHGRPGEDGTLQAVMEKLQVPYNGSPSESSAITINKYKTNELLMQNGFLCAQHQLISSDEFMAGEEACMQRIESDFTYPFIAKPVDDGCSSAVKKIRNREELKAFATLMFRQEEEPDTHASEILHIKSSEEFPRKNEMLIESLISAEKAAHFLEITIGLMTSYDENGKLAYKIFEASEALAGGEVLSLEEKFLAGEGQNITPARYASEVTTRTRISEAVKAEILKAAQLLNLQGYARIDAFVRIFDDFRTEVIFIEVNSLPGMTPATCIFHQTALEGMTPLDFIDHILRFGIARKNRNAS
ncbi:MAG: D-alanine--D-alanine ligase [Bacteroidota bacterium]